MIKKMFVVLVLLLLVLEIIGTVDFLNYTGDNLLDHQIKSCQQYYSLLGIKFPLFKMYHLCVGSEEIKRDLEKIYINRINNN